MSTQITHLEDIENFAISDERSRIGYITSRSLSRNGPVGIVQSTATIIDLKSGGAARIDGITGLVASCGTILQNQIGAASSRPDLITDSEIDVPYVRFRCSSDRKTIVGITRDGGKKSEISDLYVGSIADKKVAAADDVHVHYFNVSPDGSGIAWFNGQKPLCEISALGSPVCGAAQSDLTDSLSVSNSGEVLVATSTDRGCFYKTGYYFSDRPFPGGPKQANDVCVGIGYWRPGLQSPQIVEPLGRNPQWIDPATAALLRAWSTRLGH